MEAKVRSANSSRNASGTSVHSRTESQERALESKGYFLGSYLGEGSYAQVFEAEFSERQSHRRVKLACKVISSRDVSKEYIQRFFPREVEILRQLNHPHLIRVHSVLQRKDLFYIFMELAGNGDMLEFILRHGAVKERQARLWFRQLLTGLKYLHDHNIVHRDIKCENLLLTKAFNVKITDFGFARFAVDDGGKQIKSTTFCGSVSYVPPEVIKGQPYFPKLVDIWAVGIVLFVMLNKAWPFDPTRLTDLYEAQMSRKWKIRSKVEPLLSWEVKLLLHSLLEPYPENRRSLESILDDPWLKPSNIGPHLNAANQPVNDTALQDQPSASKIRPVHSTLEGDTKNGRIPASEPKSMEIHPSVACTSGGKCNSAVERGSLLTLSAPTASMAANDESGFSKFVIRPKSSTMATTTSCGTKPPGLVPLHSVIGANKDSDDNRK